MGLGGFPFLKVVLRAFPNVTNDHTQQFHGSPVSRHVIMEL